MSNLLCPSKLYCCEIKTNQLLINWQPGISLAIMLTDKCVCISSIYQMSPQTWDIIALHYDMMMQERNKNSSEIIYAIHKLFWNMHFDCCRASFYTKLIYIYILDVIHSTLQIFRKSMFFLTVRMLVPYIYIYIYIYTYIYMVHKLVISLSSDDLAPDAGRPLISAMLSKKVRVTSKISFVVHCYASPR